MRSFIEYLKCDDHYFFEQIEKKFFSSLRNLKENELILLFFFLLESPNLKDLVKISGLANDRDQGLNIFDVIHPNKFILQQKINARLDKAEKRILAILNTNESSFVNSVTDLANAPVKSFITLQTLSDRKDFIGFYSCIIVAHCYIEGLGTSRSYDDALKAIEKGIKNALEAQLSVDCTLLLGFLEKFNSKNSDVSRAICKSLVDLSMKNVPVFRSHANLEYYYNDILDKITNLKDNLGPKNKDLDQAKEELDKYYDRVYSMYCLSKLRFYEETLAEDLDWSIRKQLEFYELWSKDEDLKNPSVNPNGFFDLLFKHCQKTAKDSRDLAIKFYKLHLLLSNSPKSAMVLADMAANAKLSKTSDFPTCAQYFSKALDEAIRECDFETTSKVIAAYKEFENSIPKQNRIDLESKIRLAINTIKNLNEQKDEALSFRIEHTVSTKKETMASMPRRMTSELLTLMTQHSLGLEFVSGLKALHVNSDPSAYSWFVLVAEAVPQDGSAAAKKMVTEAYLEILPHLTTDLEIFDHKIDLNTLIKLLRLILKHKLYVENFEQNQALFSVLNKALSAKIINAALKTDTVQLEQLKTIYSEIHKEIPVTNNLIVVNYWLDRSNFEKSYRTDQPLKKQAPFFDIYTLAGYVEKGEVPRGAWLRTSYLDQLKAKTHPEAYLKVAQWLYPKISPKSSEQELNDFGVHIIKAMTCVYVPGDPLGIYASLAFDMINQLEMARKQKGSFNEAQSSIIHFYYALALLIKNPKLFDNEMISLFEGKNYQSTAKAAIDLLNDPSLMFLNEVKRLILNRIIGLDHIPDMLKRTAQFMAGKLPRPVIAPPPINPAAVSFPGSVQEMAVPIPVPLAPAAEPATSASAVESASSATATSSEPTTSLPDATGSVLIMNDSETARPPFNPAVIAAAEESAEKPIPVQAQQISATNAVLPQQQFDVAAMQAELAELKLRYEAAMADLAQKEAMLKEKQGTIEKKDAELQSTHAKLVQTEEKLATSEKKASALEAKHAQFFNAMLTQSKMFSAALETAQEQKSAQP